MSATPSSPVQDSDCHQRLIEAARQAFCSDGFRGASVDRIAAAAGVAKQTLYNHFPSKEALFEESIRQGVRDIVVELNDASGDFRHGLVAFSLAFRGKLLSPDGLRWYRTMIAELSRLPELGKMVWRQGPCQTQQTLADFLKLAMDRGDLRRDDPSFAAEMLTSMLVNLDRTRGLLAGEPDTAADAKRAERIVDCFLRAYRPE